MLQELSLEQVRPDPNQPRTVFKEETIRELADSIQERGLIQPITVRPNGDGYYITTGERRYRAHVLLGAPTIPAIIRDSERNGEEILATQLIENLNREDMNPIETAKGLNGLIDSGWPIEKIAKTLGYAPATIERKLSLNELDPRIQKHVGTGQIPESIALLLTRLSTEGQYLALRKIKGRSYAQAKPVVDAILEQEQQIALFGSPQQTKKKKSLVKHYKMAMLALVTFAKKITGPDYRILAAGLDDGKLGKRIAEIGIAVKQLKKIRRELETYQQRKKLRRG